MGYVLRNGKRYYQDANGNLSLDNVSQEEADRRERNAESIQAFRTSYTAPPRSTVVQNAGPATVTSHRSMPWGAILVAVIGLMLAGAFFYNQNHISQAEKAISDYMDQAADDSEEYYEADNEEQAAEEEAATVSSGNEMAERYLDVSEIAGYSQDGIQRMINTIYARHGREFHSQENAEYFAGMDWYDPVPGKTDEEIVQEFNEYEKANVDLLSGCL